MFTRRTFQKSINSTPHKILEVTRDTLMLKALRGLPVLRMASAGRLPIPGALSTSGGKKSAFAIPKIAINVTVQ